MTNLKRTRLMAVTPLAGLLTAALLTGCHHDETPAPATPSTATYPGYPGGPAGYPGYPGGPAGRPGYPGGPASYPGYPGGAGGSMMNKPSTNPNGAVGDAVITAKVKSAIIADTKVGAKDVNVDTKSGVVVLRGNVHSASAKAAAEADAKKMQGVTQVKDQLTVNPKM